MKRILIISEYHLIRTFLGPTFNKLKSESSFQADCLIITKLSKEQTSYLKQIFQNVYFLSEEKIWFKTIPKVRFFSFLLQFRNIIKNLSNYDFIHINFFHYYYIFIIGLIRKKSRKLYVSFFGSDFNQIEWYRHWMNKKSLKKVDGVFSIPNRYWLNSILEKYNLTNRNISKDNFIPHIPSFSTFNLYLKNNTYQNAKTTLGIKKTTIVCGYSAAKITRHNDIIDALLNLQHKLRQFKIIFPMAYANSGGEIQAKVKERLKNSVLDYTIMEKYLSPEEVQIFRLSSDIFIHIQSRDQMSHSMLEHLAAGSIVITGKWLPYEGLIEMGIFLIQIDKVENLSSALIDTSENLEKYREKAKVNRKIILDMMDWNNIKKNWYKYYELEEK